MKYLSAGRRRATPSLLIAALLGLSLATPASAAGFTDFLNNIVDELNSAKQPLAIIALMITGVLYMFNVIDMRRTGFVIMGIIIIYAAAEILSLITG